jgi:MoaA/NifB/PqqE/SkfB family radical SAM enzyme
MAWRYAAHRLDTVHPYEVQAMLHNACNLKCVYCRCPEMRTEVLSTDQWLGLIRALGKLGTVRIKFQGGEPTLRRDFATLCREARRAGMLAAVVTNGVRIAQDPALLEPLDEVVVSLDATTPAIHDRLRGAGTHALAVAAIDAARGRRLPVYVVMVVTQANVAEVQPMLEFCRARGLRVNVQPALFGRSYFDERGRPLGLDAEQIRALHTDLARFKRAGAPLMFSAATYERTALWPDYAQLTERGAAPSPCMAGRFYVHLDPNGDVHPCQQHGATFQPKNVLRDGLVPALRHAQGHDCVDCFSTYLNERKALFAFRPSALREILRR